MKHFSVGLELGLMTICQVPSNTYLQAIQPWQLAVHGKINAYVLKGNSSQRKFTIRCPSPPSLILIFA